MFTVEQLEYITNLYYVYYQYQNSNSEMPIYYFATTLKDNASYDLAIYFYTDYMPSIYVDNGSYYIDMNSYRVAYVNTTKEGEVLNFSENEEYGEVPFSTTLPIASNFYNFGYCYNPIIYQDIFSEMLNVDVQVPEITVPEAKVTIDNTTDISTALNNYVPPVFITVMPIMVGLVVMYLFIFRLFRKH